MTEPKAADVAVITRVAREKLPGFQMGGSAGARDFLKALHAAGYKITKVRS